MRRIFAMFFLCAAAAWGSEDKGFSASLSEADYKAAGLDKLSDEERARLDALVAANAAPGRVIVAGKDVAEESRPKPVKGRIAGSLRGWEEGTIITFEDGRRWRVVDKGSYRAAPVRKSPEVELHPLANGNFIMVVKTVPRHAEVARVEE